LAIVVGWFSYNSCKNFTSMPIFWILVIFLPVVKNRFNLRYRTWVLKCVQKKYCQVAYTKQKVSLIYTQKKCIVPIVVLYMFRFLWIFKNWKSVW
jgi:hypothetical protein